MSVLDVYKNLPGMLVSFKDGGLSARGNTITDDAVTDSVLILGTSSDGPIMEPIAVDDDTVNLFGTGLKSNGVPDGSTLIKAYTQARKRGCNDIRLMRVTGTQAETIIKGKALEATTSETVSEDFVTIQGNDETTIQLANKNLVKDSTKVTISDVQLLTGYTVSENDGTILISSCMGKAGAPVSITYNYYKDKAITAEEQTATENLSSEIVITLNNKAKDGTIQLVNKTQADASIDSANFTVAEDKKTITITSGAAKEDVIEASYTTTEVSAPVTETGDVQTGVPFKLATSKVKTTLSKDAVESSIKLIINGNFADDQSVMTYNKADNTVEVDKSDFEVGDVLKVGYNYVVTETTTPSIKLYSYCAGSVYNDGTVAIENVYNTDGTSILGKKVVITKPLNKRSSIEKPLEYTSLDYPTLGMLVDAINTDSNNGIYQADTEYDEIATADLELEDATTFTGGDDGIKVTKQDLYHALSGERDQEGYLTKSGAYQILEDYQVDWIVPTGVYADDKLELENQNFAYQLALLCTVLSYRNKTTLGAISMAPNKDKTLSGVQEYAKKCANFNNYWYLLDENGEVYKDSDGNAMDIGKYITICAGPEAKVTDSTLGTFYGNPAVDYVAYNSILVPESAPTNKKLPNATSLRFSFSNAQLDAITGNRIVTFRYKSNRNNAKSVAIVDCVTCAAPNSDYTRITSFKVVRYVVDDIREVADPYIGEPNTVENRNALSAAISKRLSIHKEAGRILDSEFQLVATAESSLLGEAKLELTIVPPQELRKLTTVVGLKASL